MGKTTSQRKRTAYENNNLNKTRKAGENMHTKHTNLAQVHIPGAPPLPGLKFRPYRGEEDLPAILELSNLVSKYDQAEELDTLEELTNFYRHLKNCDPSRDVVIGEVGGEMIAYCRVWWVKEKAGPYVYHLFGRIHPEWRGRGLGTALLRHNENRLREVARDHDHPEDADKVFESWTISTTPWTTALLEKAGYQPARYFCEMVRPIDRVLPEAPLPEGLEIRPFEEAHNRAIFEAADEAFRDHWGYTESTEEDYQRFTEDPSRKPHLWKVAWDGDQVAGMVRNVYFEEENEYYNRQRGWTEDICVRRPWRRQGLATALIARSIEMFRSMGFEETALGVDTKNPSGALDLYEKMGYKEGKTWTAYRKPWETEE
jgi:GNAT superfamily N-acetyltransferase